MTNKMLKFPEQRIKSINITCDGGLDYQDIDLEKE